MNPTSIRAKKSLGQNFLIDHEALSDIANSIVITGKNIIEVGPGYGALTEYITRENPANLDLVELDNDMIPLLEENYIWENIHLHHQDILSFIPPYEAYSVIANIPYYITSPILFHFLYPQKKWWKLWNKNIVYESPEEMIIMMQKEVWEKILEWRARKPHHSYISLAMEQACDNIEIVRYVWRTSFDPPPKVDSIVLKFTGKKNRNRELENNLLNLWKIAFTHPRKTLLSNLKWSIYERERIRLIFRTLWYDEKVRSEAVRMEDWIMFL